MSLELDPAREQAELEQYLGARFQLGRLRAHEHELEREYAACGDEQRFYRTSEAYLYDLTAFAMTATKLAYLQDLAGLVLPGARVLDYGCGIGSDGLLLAEAGYRVEFADFDNPSVAYLRWRLERRGIEAPVHDLDREVPGGFDAAYAFDVIEHVDDPLAFLAQLESRARLVVVNLLEPRPSEHRRLHRELPIAAIRNRACAAGLRRYRIYHRRSHLLAYEPGSAGAVRALGGRLAVLRERFRSHVRPR